MTIYNGTLVAMGYKDQGSLTTGNQDAETFVLSDLPQLKIRFY
jgi:hypothetical protein